MNASGARVVEPFGVGGLSLARRGRSGEVRPRPRDHGCDRMSAGASR